VLSAFVLQTIALIFGAINRNTLDHLLHLLLAVMFVASLFAPSTCFGATLAMVVLVHTAFFGAFAAGFLANHEELVRNFAVP
jgi:hypothetical protein